MQVSALPGLGMGDLDPQTATLNESSVGRLLSASMRLEATNNIRRSWTDGTCIITYEAILKISETIIILRKIFI
tara:strand:- start:503 stop:724 length:222 start_codon:yes stop_codon:yes gene_type:complete